MAWRPAAYAMLAVALVAASFWYVTAPPKGLDGYRERAGQRLETIRSQVQSSRIWLESLDDEEATRSATLVGLREAERDSSESQSDFQEQEAPDGTARLRARFGDVASRAVDALRALRVAAEQERWDELPRLAEPLPRIAADLERLEQEVRQ